MSLPTGTSVALCISSEKGGDMLEIIAVATFVVALTIVARGQTSDDQALTGSRTSMLTVGVQIICGDCSGNDYLPKKTLLGRDGACAQCGGHSYILASNRVSNAQQIMISRLSAQESAASPVSLRPVEGPSSIPTTQLDSVTAFEGWTLVTSSLLS
jgi:Zn finger protein HypA/HybF involved in hydrogenase expression